MSAIFMYRNVLHRRHVSQITSSRTIRILLLALATYLLWVLATYLLEGRILTLLRPEAITDRVVYTVVANIIIGSILALIVIRHAMEEKATSPASAGFRPLPRTVIAVVIAGILGFILLLLLQPPTLDPIVLLNVYAQVFTVTIAEIAVCWALIGSTIEGVLQSRGRIPAIIVGIIGASLLFGIYHIGHSPPFNTVSMIAFLSLFGVVTSLVFFIGRDIYATMVFHNFFGGFGVMQSLAAAGALAGYTRPLYPVIGMAVLSTAVFIGMDVFLIRKRPAGTG